MKNVCDEKTFARSKEKMNIYKEKRSVKIDTSLN
jgi:hypothetical protein